MLAIIILEIFMGGSATLKLAFRVRKSRKRSTCSYFDCTNNDHLHNVSYATIAFKRGINVQIIAMG